MRADIPSIMITNSGSQRFDLFKGVFNRNDQFVASPFSDSFLFIPGIPLSVAGQVLPALNGDSAMKKRAILEGREEELYARGHVDMRYRAWLEEQAKRDDDGRKRLMANLTLGYATKDVSDNFFLALHVSFELVNSPALVSAMTSLTHHCHSSQLQISSAQMHPTLLTTLPSILSLLTLLKTISLIF